MKNTVFFQKNAGRIIPAVIFIFLSICLYSQEPSGNHFKSILDVKTWWKGWLNNPDTIRIKADSTFNASKLDSLKKAANRWNAAGCRPALKVVTTGSGEINCTIGNNLSDSSSAEATTHRDADKKVTGADIVFGPGNDYNFTELATHELGHPLGLLDTDKNSHQKDVMKGEGENGTLGVLSMHDSAEIARAKRISDSVWNSERLVSVTVGTRDTVPFKLPQVYPPAVASQAIINVVPLADPWCFVFEAYIIDNMIYIDCMIPPSHWAGMVFLDVAISFPTPYDPLSFLGYFTTSIDPVPPTSFTCPFELGYKDGNINVTWVANCTYPYQSQAIRSNLLVTNLADQTSMMVQNKDGGDYLIHLEPGIYEIKLEVDDFQVNSTVYSQTINYSGMEDLQIDRHAQPKVFPNPFDEICNITCDPSASIRIIDEQGKMVDFLSPGTCIWKPSSSLSPGTYYLNILSSSGQFWNEKVIYLPK